MQKYENLTENQKWLLTRDNQFRYMMLSKLQSDCEYFLDWGKGRLSILENSSIESHTNLMKSLWDSFEEKPQWLSFEQIEKYEIEMNSKECIE